MDSRRPLRRGNDAHPFSVEERELQRVLTGEHGLHAILDVVLEGKQTPHHAVLKDYQLDPTRARSSISTCTRCASTAPSTRRWSSSSRVIRKASRKAACSAR